MNIKEKRTFWDRSGILMSGNKYLLFIQLCKEMPEASKPSEPVMPGHPTQTIPKSTAAIPSTLQKMGQSRGKGLVQPLKSHSTHSSIVYLRALSISKWELLCWDVSRLSKAADLCSYKQHLALHQAPHQGINTFPPPKPSCVTGHQAAASASAWAT